MQTQHKSRGLLFYILLGVFCIVPLVFYIVLLGDVLKTENGMACLFFALFTTVLCVDVLIVYNPKGEMPKKDTLAVVFAILTVVSFFGLAVAFNLLFMDDFTWATVLLALGMSFLCHVLPGFAVWQIFIGSKKQDKFSYTYHPHTQESEGSENDGKAAGGGIDKWIDRFNPTKDYYGMHGEFDKNDDSWGTSEYIRQFRNANPEDDLSDHFDWQEMAEAESDGFI